MKLAGIYFLRPLSFDDPAFANDNGKFFLPELIGELLRQSLFSTIIISIPSSTPCHIVKVIESWGVQVDKTGQDAPVQRLKRIVSARGFDYVACFTAYNFFINDEAVKHACDLIVFGHKDFIYTNNVITAKHFCVMNLKAVDCLCEISDVPVAPNRFHQVLLEHENGLTIGTIKDLEEPGERLLWDLHYAGESQSIPVDLLKLFFSETLREEWFKREHFKALLCTHLAINNFDWLNDDLEKFPSILARSTEFASQFAWFHRWIEFIPKKGDSFLELGFGAFPVTSQLLLERFDNGIAIEPCGYDEKNVSHAIGLCDRLVRDIPRLVYPHDTRKNKKIEDLEGRLRIESQLLEDMELADASVDFCFSKTVFEHVMNVEALSSELFRVLKPGGSMIHEIDFSDHRNGNIIHFNFLKYDREEWLSHNQGTNLWRIIDYLTLWQKLGFEASVLSRKNTNIVPPALHTSWEQYSKKDLLCHTAVIKATRKK